MVAIGVTGHRDLREPNAVSLTIDRALQQILAYYGPEDLRVISPLAEGADRLLVWRALEKYPLALIVPLPLAVDEYLRDFKTPSSKAAFKTLLAQASQVVRLPPQPTREESYLSAGLYVLDHSDVLVAMWDGGPPRGTGGTADIVAEARRRGLPLAWIRVERKGMTVPSAGAGRSLSSWTIYEGFPSGFGDLV